MAMQTDLQIYKVSMDLFKLATGLTRNIPRDLKQVISKRVMDDCMEILTLIGRANSNRDKRPHLELLLEKVHQVDLVMRLCTESRFISPEQQSKTILLTSSIGKQANAWKRTTPTAPAI